MGLPIIGSITSSITSAIGGLFGGNMPDSYPKVPAGYDAYLDLNQQKIDLSTAWVGQVGSDYYAAVYNGIHDLHEKKYHVTLMPADPTIVPGSNISIARAKGASPTTGLPVNAGNPYSWDPRSNPNMREGAGFNAFTWPKPWVNVSNADQTFVVGGTAYVVKPGQTIYQYNGTAPVLGGTGLGTNDPAGNNSVANGGTGSVGGIGDIGGSDLSGGVQISKGTLVVVGLLALWALTRSN